MSIAERPAKNTMRCTRCAGQSTLTQRCVGLALEAHERLRRTPGTAWGTSTCARRFLRLASTGPDDLGDDVAGLAHDHGVADAHVFARDLVLVVQRGEPDGGAADEHRLELRERRGAPGAPDAHHDVAQHGGLLLGRELERDRPARRLAREAELVALREVVDLHHRAVDVVAERVAVRLDALAELVDRRRATSSCSMWSFTGSPRSRSHVERLVVRRQRGTALLHAELVRVEREVARRGDARVLLPQAPGGGVARVGEEPLAGVALAPVELLERRERHEHLAPHLEPRRASTSPCSCSRDRGDGGDVGGDVLAGLAVAARGAAHEPAVLVEQRDREPVELGLADEARPGR